MSIEGRPAESTTSAYRSPPQGLIAREIAVTRLLEDMATTLAYAARALGVPALPTLDPMRVTAGSVLSVASRTKHHVAESRGLARSS